MYLISINSKMAPDSCDEVAPVQVLKSLEILELKARKEWHKKWGFYLDFNKICIEEAAKRGISEKEYNRISVMRKSKGSMEADIWKIEPTKYVPITTTGCVGLRATANYSLEKLGPLYISPKLTLPYEPPHSSIMLG